MEIIATIDALYIYPIKSVGHVALDSVEISNTGFKYDREWMLTDREGNFLTQREFPIMNQILVNSIDDVQISLQYNNKSSSFCWNNDNSQIIDTKIWKSQCKGKIETRELNQYFSDILKSNVILVRMQKDSRIKSNEFMPQKTSLQYVDGYPIHIINKSSVDDISTRSGESIQNLQFRPNIVLSGIPAFIEERFSRLIINGSEWSFAKKCVRCIMTTLRPNEFIFNKEPLKTLASYRKHKNQIEFGVYMYSTENTETRLQKSNVLHAQIS